MSELKAYTRYNNEHLFKYCQSLVPIEVEKGKKFNNWRDAATYLEWVVSHGDRVAMNIDIDCFVTDWDVLMELVKDFEEGGYTYCGIPDAGVIPGRANLSWVVTNPFFNLFDSNRILMERAVTKQDMDWEDIRRFGFRWNWYEQRPDWVSEYEQCMWEPFNGFFNWLYSWGSPLFIQGETHSDGISTVIKYKDRPFALHSWYSREFNANPEHRARITNLYREACSIRKQRPV